MNKKKACIESLAALEPEIKVKRLESTGLSNSSNSSDVTTGKIAEVVDKSVTRNSNSDTNEKESDKLMNACVFNDEISKALRQAYASGSSYNEDFNGVHLDCYPFRHCILQNFLSDDDYVLKLENELKDISVQEKNNDLYKFQQSGDLKLNKSSAISKMRSQLSQLRDFLSTVSDIPLNSKIDLFCSQYKYTDILLCHDDELEERRIAFIYYLVPDTWSAADGGTLDLFDTDEHNQPKDVVKSLVPKRNSLAFFEVSSKSFHQVAEILSEDKTRLSLSGWFHGPLLARPPPHLEALPRPLSYGSTDEKIFYSWFNPLYLAPDVQSEVRDKFEEDSQIQLSDFLKKEKYEELLAALETNGMRWKRIGPANRNNFSSASKDDLPSIVAEFLSVMQSDATFLVLSNLTRLKLHPLAKFDKEEGCSSSNGASSSDSVSENDGVKNPRCRSDIRKWRHGDYTLARDTDSETTDFALDVALFIGCPEDWSYEHGGYTSYIAKGEDLELLSVSPSGNNLALVYRDKDVMRFVKHLNHRFTKLPSDGFYEFNCVYWE